VIENIVEATSIGYKSFFLPRDIYSMYCIVCFDMDNVTSVYDNKRAHGPRSSAGSTSM